MSLNTVPLASLVPPNGNPRTATDDALIEGLAKSIRADGLLQNLIVRPHRRGKYQVIAGGRRLAALKLIEQEGAIDGTYPVPVEIRQDLTAADALRLATVENVQREPLTPIDEAEAFVTLAQDGADLETIAATMGVSPVTVRRRLVLANLCPEAKEQVRAGDLPLGIAEAMTLGSHEQQQQILESFAEGYEYDREELRYMLLREKPSVAMAVFPLEQYTGTLTTDLFAEAETTYFDDADAFFRLQEAAVKALADGYRNTASWTEITRAHNLPTWQYKEAEDGDEHGVVINLSPSGRVEIREGLAKHPVREEVAAAAASPPVARERGSKPKPAYSQDLVRYIGAHKSLAVQASLLENPRAAKGVAAVMLLEGRGAGDRIRREPHPAFSAFAEEEIKPKAYQAIEAEALRLASPLGYQSERARGEGMPSPAAWESLCRSDSDILDLYAAVKGLDEATLDGLLVLLPLLSFGQDSLERLESDETLFNRVARDLGVDMRAWWRPDETFLAARTREQLAAIIADSGAVVSISRPGDYSKPELVKALARHFARTASKEPRDEFDEKGRDWLPDVMTFPAAPEPVGDAAE